MARIEGRQWNWSEVDNTAVTLHCIVRCEYVKLEASTVGRDAVLAITNGPSET